MATVYINFHKRSHQVRKVTVAPEVFKLKHSDVSRLTNTDRHIKEAVQLWDKTEFYICKLLTSPSRIDIFPLAFNIDSIKPSHTKTPASTVI